MNNHRAAIESAATACGIDGKYNAVTEEFYLSEGEVDPSGKGREWWNPLIDSADCAAMCAKLKIDTCWYADRVVCSSGEHYSAYNTQFDGHEISWRYAATQVAAAIGEGK